MQAVTGNIPPAIPDPSIPLARVKEQILEDYLSHPTDKHEIICKRNGRNPYYLVRLLKQPIAKARLEYLKKTTFKEKEKSLIWTQEQIISNVQNRLAKAKSDIVYLKGHEMLARWKGMDKITTTVKTDTNQPLQVVFQEVEKKT